MQREFLECSCSGFPSSCFAGAFLEVSAWQQDLNPAPLNSQRSCGKVSGEYLHFNQFISIFLLNELQSI